MPGTLPTVGHLADDALTASRPAPGGLRSWASVLWPLPAAALLVASDWAYHRTGDSLVPGAPLDETAHLMTAVLALGAMPGRFRKRSLASALIASVAIDLDHVPQHVGIDWLTAGTPRPYTHSLTTMAVALGLAVCLRRHRDVMLGVTLGLAIHFVRDLAEGQTGVSLLWPFTDRPYSYSHGLYLAGMAVVVAFDLLVTIVRGYERVFARGSGP